MNLQRSILTSVELQKPSFSPSLIFMSVPVLVFLNSLFLTAASCTRRDFYTPPPKFGSRIDYQSAINRTRTLHAFLHFLSFWHTFSYFLSFWQTFSTFSTLSHTFSAYGILSQLLVHFLILSQLSAHFLSF